MEEFGAIRALVDGASIDDAVLAVCAGDLQTLGELPRRAVTPGAARADRARNAPWTIGHRHGHRWIRCNAWRASTRRRRQAAGALRMRSRCRCCTTTTDQRAEQAEPGCTAQRMTSFSAILPISDGMGLVFAVTCYDGRIVVSLDLVPRAAMPDPQCLHQCVRDSFQEYP